MPVPSVTLRHVAVAACLLLLAACGGGDAEPAKRADSAAPAGATDAEEPVLNVYNWSDYIAPDTIANFERETGIKVRYDVFDSNEVLEAKLLAGNTGYDIVVPTANFVARQIQAGVFQPLDRSLLTNYANLDPTMLKTLAAYDPDNRYAVPYLWSTTGFGYNVAKVRERMPDAPVDSWRLLFDPAVVAHFKDCGVSLLDAPSEVVPAMLRYLGLPTGSQSEADLAKVEQALSAMRAQVRYFHSSQYLNDLAAGEVCVAMGWGGDVFQARSRAREAGQGTDIAYVIPREGAMIAADTMAIPKDAPHPRNAHRFIDYILRAEVAAAISNTIGYANANRASTPLLEPALAADKSVYPDEAVRATLFPSVVNTPAYDRLLTRAWTRVKTHQ